MQKRFDLSILRGIIFILLISLCIAYLVYLNPNSKIIEIIKYILIYVLFSGLFYVLYKYDKMYITVSGIIAFLIIFFNPYLFYINHIR